MRNYSYYYVELFDTRKILRVYKIANGQLFDKEHKKNKE